MTSPGYTCSFYRSGDVNYETLFINRTNSKEEYIKPNKSLTQYVVKEIKKGNLDLILEKGKRSKLYPEDYIYITIATRKNKAYNIEFYTTKYFILDSEGNVSD